MKMRDGDNAVVELVRLQLYCLDPRHPRGAHKARQFATRLGLSTRDAETLQQTFLRAARRSDQVQVGERDDNGQRYSMDVEVTGPNGTATARTSWITREGDAGPRFLTCYLV